MQYRSISAAAALFTAATAITACPEADPEADPGPRDVAAAGSAAGAGGAGSPAESPAGRGGAGGSAAGAGGAGGAPARPAAKPTGDQLPMDSAFCYLPGTGQRFGCESLSATITSVRWQVPYPTAADPDWTAANSCALPTPTPCRVGYMCEVGRIDDVGEWHNMIGYCDRDR
jgi:hypothetical protein